MKTSFLFGKSRPETALGVFLLQEDAPELLTDILVLAGRRIDLFEEFDLHGIGSFGFRIAWTTLTLKGDGVFFEFHIDFFDIRHGNGQENIFTLLSPENTGNLSLFRHDRRMSAGTRQDNRQRLSVDREEMINGGRIYFPSLNHFRQWRPLYWCTSFLVSLPYLVMLFTFLYFTTIARVQSLIYSNVSVSRQWFARQDGDDDDSCPTFAFAVPGIDAFSPSAVVSEDLWDRKINALFRSIIDS